MASALSECVRTALAQFASATRLYALAVGDDERAATDQLLVEGFIARDVVQAVGACELIVLSVDAHLALATMLGQSATLYVSLADGTRARVGGEITAAASLGSEGGLARYRLQLSPWIWRLGQVRNSRVWQDKSVIEIVDEVFAPYAPRAKWRWSAETEPFMAGASVRSYCCQYRESDLDFVQRLLAEEGLGWRIEQTEEGPGVVLFADSTQLDGVPEDASSAGAGGIRFHNARAGEKQDTIQALQLQQAICASRTSLLSYDYKTKQIVSATSHSRLPRKAALGNLESFDVPGQYAFTNLEQAQRYADLRMEAKEADSEQWSGRSTVRTLRAGTRITILDAPLERLGERPGFTILSVIAVGVNNLPTQAKMALAELFGPLPDLLQEVGHAGSPAQLAPVIAQASLSGYANSFAGVASEVPWRPHLPGATVGGPPRATALGAQTAIVVGADGNDQPQGADELYCDRLGRVRIRFHWQEDGNASCWVRVAQRSAGGGMGSQFLPRIGQEVLVKFMENDIDRPVIVGAMYNGQGEGGLSPTPGGRAADASQVGPFGASQDHTPSAQGNLAGGNHPLWHGASSDSDGHRNGAAQWGVRSKEFGGRGYNQLLFDDTDAQGRVQLRCSHAGSELTMGHMVHSADNYRGSFRGHGAELRTDAYGAVRAGGGLLITSYKVAHGAGARDPAGDNAPGIALLKQVTMLAKAFHQGAGTHQTVGLASHAGSVKADSSVANNEQAPLSAALAAVSAMVGTSSLSSAQDDAREGSAEPAGDKLPHTGKPTIAISAKGGLGVAAGQSVQVASADTVTLVSGLDSQFISGGAMRMHSGQAVGILGGAMAAGEANVGVELIAAKDAIEVQAQSDTLALQARDDVDVVSANAHIDWAAAKRISLSTAGGANITIEGGNITIRCPGKIMIHAGKKSFSGPARSEYVMPVMPNSRSSWVQLDARYDDAWNTPWPLDRVDFSLDGKVVVKSIPVNPIK